MDKWLPEGGPHLDQRRSTGTSLNRLTALKMASVEASKAYGISSMSVPYHRCRNRVHPTAGTVLVAVGRNGSSTPGFPTKETTR